MDDFLTLLNLDMCSTVTLIDDVLYTRQDGIISGTAVILDLFKYFGFLCAFALNDRSMIGRHVDDLIIVARSQPALHDVTRVAREFAPKFFYSRGFLSWQTKIVGLDFVYNWWFVLRV